MTIRHRRQLQRRRKLRSERPLLVRALRPVDRLERTASPPPASAPSAPPPPSAG